MAWLTMALLERLMQNRVQEAFVAAAVGIMTTPAGPGGRLDSLV
jgi:hypothetical protein